MKYMSREIVLNALKRLGQLAFEENMQLELLVNGPLWKL